MPAAIRSPPSLRALHNSMRGAAFLSGVADGVVIDVGGTTTDVGILVGGFPREASVVVRVGGLATNFRMPDVLSLGIGGGSLVRCDGDEGDRGSPIVSASGSTNRHWCSAGRSSPPPTSR